MAAIDPGVRALLEMIEPAVSGRGGHAALLAVARTVVATFGLGEDDATAALMAAYNPRCRPPWGEPEVRLKVREAVRLTAEGRARAAAEGVGP